VKQKSLRQLARECGVSASYLSQVKNGKRPASQKVLSSVKQNQNQFLNPIQVRYQAALHPDVLIY
jgi:transcriptional regulator with XRE-family HTH domain